VKAIGGGVDCAKAAAINEAPTRRARENNMAKGVLRVTYNKGYAAAFNESRLEQETVKQAR
jgi:hypothetical protein